MTSSDVLRTNSYPFLEQVEFHASLDVFTSSYWSHGPHSHTNFRLFLEEFKEFKLQQTKLLVR